MTQNDPFLNEVVRNSDRQDWLIISFLILTVAYIVVKLFYGKYWRKYRQAVFYSQESQKLIYEKNVILMQAAISLNVLATFSIGLFVYLFIKHFGWIELLPANIYGWALSTLFVVIVTGLKYFIVGFLGNAVDNKALTSQINHQFLVNHKNFGFFLLPVSVCSAFMMPPMDSFAIYLGLAILAFMLILNYLKSFLFLYQHRISIYYGIVYLCTLEILPILIIWKVIRFLIE